MKKCLLLNRRRAAGAAAPFLGEEERYKGRPPLAVAGSECGARGFPVSFPLSLLLPPSRGRGKRTEGGTGQVNPHCEQFLGGEGDDGRQRRRRKGDPSTLRKRRMLHWTQTMEVR